MDSLTQLVLGSAVCEAVAGRESGRKAAYWGAALGTFPDLDVFVPMGNPVANFVLHRSFSHSLLALAVCALLWVWVVLKSHPREKSLWIRWTLAVLAVFYTHILLDCMTVYGTQIFWPFSSFPVSLGTLFIVDPCYTLPLLLGSVLYLVYRSPWGYYTNIAGLALSSLYLLWAMSVQSHVRLLSQQSSLWQPGTRVLVTPTPLNTLLWRIVMVAKEGYHVGYYSILDDRTDILFNFVPSRYDIADRLEGVPAVQKIRQFSHGFFTMDKQGSQWVISDIRMGIEPHYVFRFAVAKQEGGELTPIEPVRVRDPMDLERLRRLYQRIFDNSVVI